MSLTANDTNEIIKKYQKAAGDCGSTEVQIAILTAKIKDLTPHFKKHIHDHHSRRGLLRMVSQRRKLLSYLKKVNLTGYRELIKELGLRS